MISVLDCTLRDGGYVNDWNFGHNNIVNIFERLVDARVDIIEIGFLDERRPFDINRSIMPNTDAVEKIFGHLDKGSSKVVAMIDYGTCSLSNIKDCKDSFLDGIRVIFKKHLMIPALQFCGQLKEKGYKVFAQLVSVTSYSDEELISLVELANEIKPDVVSMVDTYGLMHQDNLSHCFDVLDRGLNPDIGLGYHGHNNFQMGYANSIRMIESMLHTQRDLLIDGSLSGMGKSAGNTPIELSLMYLNRLDARRYDIDQIAEAIDSTISQFYQPATWGYNLFYYIAASNNCHPNYVSFLLHKGTLSIKSVNEILRAIPDENALLYDENLIESMYISYQQNVVNDKNDIFSLKTVFSGKSVLLLGPGQIAPYAKQIELYIKEKSPIVLGVNSISQEFNQDYIFLCNSKRYIQMSNQLSQCKYSIIATSNLTKTGRNAFKYVLNYGDLLEDAPIVADSALIMILKVLAKLNCRDVAFAGLDGYTNSVAFTNELGASEIENIPEYINTYISDFIKNIGKNFNTFFLTPSKFNKG